MSTVQQLVNENSVAEFLTASEILIKFANNVLSNPNDQKYRRIRLGNPTVEGKLLPVSGALECLFEMGFLEDGEYLSLPMSASLSIVSQIKTKLQSERAVVERSQVQTPARQQRTVATPGGRPTPSQQPTLQSAAMPGASAQSTTAVGNFMQKEALFYRKLEAQLQHVQRYEDRRLQNKAREVIPIKQLEDEAKEQLSALNGSDEGTSSQSAPLDLRDCLVLALLKWFKMSFFKWVDAPACKQCGGRTNGVGAAEPTAEEMRYGGNRVENYRCTVCGAYTRFVRYNDPGKLLETREGRCGEWANCFTLCCRALQFEARYVLDWTDHVWTEVYSNSQQRWVHCDPCENACDKPLLYEKGWGKKLTYVIAFSIDDIEDVTWRYTSDFAAVLSRRQECRENWLVNTIYNLDKKKWSIMPEHKRNIRLNRKIADLVEFLMPKKADGQNLSGRTTGSLEWRSARGETGNPQVSQQPFIFQPTPAELTEKCMHVTYSCAQDRYVRVTSGNETMRGYQSGVSSSENVFRKVESDWNMAYVARTEGSDKAEISWKFDLSGSGCVIDRVELRLDSTTFENGRIQWTVCDGDTCSMLQGSPSVQMVNDLQGSSGFTLTASLSGGRGDVAWQHTQLFRQSADDKTNTPFEVKVILK